MAPVFSSHSRQLISLFCALPRSGTIAFFPLRSNDYKKQNHSPSPAGASVWAGLAGAPARGAVGDLSSGSGRQGASRSGPSRRTWPQSTSIGGRRGSPSGSASSAARSASFCFRFRFDRRVAGRGNCKILLRGNLRKNSQRVGRHHITP